MPELPEVETIRQGLREQILGATIRDVELTGCRIFQTPAELLLARLPQQQIVEIDRRGKFLIVRLSRDRLVIHLGMTGQLTVWYPERPDSEDFLRHPVTGLQRVRQHSVDKHTHLQLQFKDGRSLWFRDPRKFGKCHLLEKESELTALLTHLGMEPLSDEYTMPTFLKGLQGRKTSIKALLLNQRVVAGVGNIYADEALFQAAIHPSRRANRLRRYEKQRLFQAIRLALEKGVTYGGTTLRDYVNSDGREGGNQDELFVYGRTGQPCPRCGTRIEKIVVAQRGTHFCPGCQSRSKPNRDVAVLSQNVGD